MSDNEIRQILIKRKREQKRTQRREELLEMISGVGAWGSLFFLAFTLFAIGG